MASVAGQARVGQFPQIRPVGPVKKKRKKKGIRHAVPASEAQLVRRYE